MTAQAKPSATTAASTSFCAAQVFGPGGHLWFDGNGKVTAGNGTLDRPRPNAFSLLQIDDCPSATAICMRACYVHGLEKHAPETHALYRHNSSEIRRILAEPDSAIWAAIAAEWIETHCGGGFRWHVSGDVFSADYAEWIGIVTRCSPGVRHWIYTRSFDLLPTLLAAAGRNLTINLSCDSENVAAARQASGRFGLRLCYLTGDGEVCGDLPDGSVIFPDYNLRGGTEAGRAWFDGLPAQYKSFVCPVDYNGKAENRRCGPCDRCLRPASGALP